MPDPAPIEPGSPEYYQERYDDFVRRNPGVEPPDYYLGYGDKYADRFSSLDSSDLSPEGLQWRDETLVRLQDAIEQKRIEDPEGFAELERDPEAFREFAFETHPDAYVDSGLFDLPLQDVTVIAATPDINDVLSQEGIAQSLVTAGKIEVEDLPDIALDTLEQAGRDILDHPFLPPPLAPGLVQGERLFDRLRDQDWFPDLDVPSIGVPDLGLPDLGFSNPFSGGGGNGSFFRDASRIVAGAGSATPAPLTGMDVAEVRALAERMAASAGSISTLMGELNQRLYQASWEGPERDQFVAEWTSIHRVKLTNAITALQDASRTAERNAAEQESTSATL